MKILMYLALAVVMLSGLSSCSGYNYYTAAINKTNLSAYHTFAWMPQAGKANKNTVNNAADTKIKDATTMALVGKGLKLSQSNPDLIVSYSSMVGIGSKTNYYSPGYYGGGYYGGGFGFGGGWGWGGFGGWGGWGGGYRPYYYGYGAPFSYGGGLIYAEKEHYKEGTLIIDLVDPHSRKIVWRGFGVGEVHHNTQKDIDDLPKVVAGLLDQLQLTSSGKRS